MITQFIIIILAVGIITAGLRIRFDRFFTIILLLFIMEKNINQSIDIFLWVIALGALNILLSNKNKIIKLESNKKKKMFIFIPIMTFIFAGLGSYLYILSSQTILLYALSVLAFLYGLRMIFIHFQEHEFNYKNEKPWAIKFCGILGPVISGVSLGFIGSSLKSLKIPFGVKVGKMNIKQVYFGNSMTSFFASSFAIIWHSILTTSNSETIFNNFLLGVSLWAGIHYIYELVDMIFPNKWRKIFQIIIGLALVIVSVKIINLI